jgi:CBS domain-containing protein
MSIPIASILARKGHDVATVTPDQTLAEAAARLTEHGIGSLVVSTGEGTIDGILSERDVVRHLAALDHPVSVAMTHPVTTCDVHATSDQVMATMTAGRHRHVPVVDDDGRLAGLVPLGDVVHSYKDDLEVRAQSLQGYVTGSSY